jgi:hypothetical protein
MTIKDVPDCSAAAITVWIQGGDGQCLNAGGGSGRYTVDLTMPDASCNTYPVSYKCGADNPCQEAKTFSNVRYRNIAGTVTDNTVHLRASAFDANCENPSTDVCCRACTETPTTCAPRYCHPVYAPEGTGCVGDINEDACVDPDLCCVAPDTCDGAGHCIDNYLTTECRPAANESCDGVTPDCPDDEFAAVNTPCVGEVNEDACVDPALCCVAPDTCDGAGFCVDNYLTTECRAAANEYCDIPENCDGENADCPANAFQPPGTACVGEDNIGACVAPDTCNGAGTCVDNYKGCDFICNGADPDDPCDLPEFCPGDAAACPSFDNRFPPACCNCPSGVNRCIPLSC